MNDAEKPAHHFTTDEWVEKIEACETVAQILDIERSAQGISFGPMQSTVLMRVFGERLNLLRARESVGAGTPVDLLPPWLAEALTKDEQARAASAGNAPQSEAETGKGSE